MPTPVQIQRITHEVDRVARNCLRHRAEGFLEYWERCFQPGLQEQFGDVVLAADIAVVGLMALLRRLGAPAPPGPLVAELMTVVQNFAHVARGGLVVELALAYGATWRRAARSGVGEWDEVWPGALQEISRSIYPIIRQTVRLLASPGRGGVRDFPCDASDRMAAREDADLVALEFIAPWSPAGRPEYERYRTVHTWDPTQGSLYGWIKRAVRGGGPQEGAPQANFFTSGHLFTLLKGRGCLAGPGDVAKELCKMCDHEADYNIGVCPRGHGQTRIVSKTVLVAPNAYRPRQFWRCGNGGCDNEFGDTRGKCPHCPRQLNTVPTHLLVPH